MTRVLMCAVSVIIIVTLSLAFMIALYEGVRFLVEYFFLCTPLTDCVVYPQNPPPG